MIVILSVPCGKTMKIRYASEVDTMTITFRDTTVTSRQVAEGIAVDYDEAGKLAGIEILDAVKRLGSKDTMKTVVLENDGFAVQA